MQIAVTFRHMDTSEAARSYVKDKVERLQKYIENPQEIHVVLSAEKFRQTAEITIVNNGMTLNSQAKDTDLYAAIDQMVDRMERQIRERKGKGQRKRTGLSAAAPALREGIGAEEESAEGKSRVERRQVSAKPMSPEEALAEFDLAGEDILFFINSNSGQMNALYRNKENGLEWVEPQSE